jgi:hypothetical protein
MRAVKFSKAVKEELRQLNVHLYLTTIFMCSLREYGICVEVISAFL